MILINQYIICCDSGLCAKHHDMCFTFIILFHPITGVIIERLNNNYGHLQSEQTPVTGDRRSCA